MSGEGTEDPILRLSVEFSSKFVTSLKLEYKPRLNVEAFYYDIFLYLGFKFNCLCSFDLFHYGKNTNVGTWLKILCCYMFIREQLHFTSSLGGGGGEGEGPPMMTK